MNMRNAALTALLALMLIPVPACAETGLDTLASAVALEDQRLHSAAAEKFIEAASALPAVADYALYHAAKSLALGGDQIRAEAVALSAIERFPRSPIRPKLLALRAETLVKINSEDAPACLETYVSEFPSDSVALFQYGELLAKRGEAEKSARVFKELYLSGCKLSDEAGARIDTSSLGGPELAARGDRLLAARQYAAAEIAFLRALLRADVPDGRAREGLARSLFGQKKYAEAARAYQEIGNTAMAAKSFLRSGEDIAFAEMLDIMKDGHDPDVVKFMVALADDLRRGGEPRRALDTLEEAARLFPAHAEPALWKIGWTHYITGDYRKAVQALDRAYAQHPSNQYLYWRARAMEHLGEDPSAIYIKIPLTDYYGFLAAQRSGIRQSASSALGSAGVRPAFSNERVDALAAVGLMEDAALELKHLAGAASGNDMRLAIAYRLVDLGLFSDSIAVVRQLPESYQPTGLLYPLAYWPEVRRASARFSIDPFLLLSVMREESRYDRMAFSPAGAIGLMQLMPQTAFRTSRSIPLALESEDAIYDAENNITIGSCYLSSLVADMKSVSHALAAYNAGRTRVETWLERGRYASADEFVEDIPYEETRNYIKRIISTYFRYMDARYPEFQEGLKIL